MTRTDSGAWRTVALLACLAACAGGGGGDVRDAAADEGTGPADPGAPDPAAFDDAPDLAYLEDACPYACPHPDPGVGSVIVSEIMHTPRGTTDPEGDWLELYNTTDWLVDVAGWVLADGTGARVVLGEPGGTLVVPPHGQVAIARTADPALNGGFVPAWAFGTALSIPAEGRFDLYRGEVLVDAVTWGGPDFPFAVGASLNLSGDMLTAEFNDASKAWCATLFHAVLPDGDFGTPGKDNQACCIRC